MISSHSVALKRRPGNRDTAVAPRSIKVLEAGSEQSATAVKAAEKMVAAARENVRFLNRHLQKFRAYLDLTPDVDNALYLAYTVRVRDSAPFAACDLRQHLHDAGIETASSFSFNDDENFDIVRNRAGSQQSLGNQDERLFCIACHQYLTIPDVEHIVDAFESFFTVSASSDRTPDGERG